MSRTREVERAGPGKGQTLPDLRFTVTREDNELKEGPSAHPIVTSIFHEQTKDRSQKYAIHHHSNNNHNCQTGLARRRARAWFVPFITRYMFLLRSSRKGVPTDPKLSTAKRQQRAHALNTTLSQAAIERRLAAAETTRLELETRLRERDTTIERLEADRRWLAEREQEEREEKERLTKEREEEKVSGKSPLSICTFRRSCY